MGLYCTICSNVVPPGFSQCLACKAGFAPQLACEVCRQPVPRGAGSCVPCERRSSGAANQPIQELATYAASVAEITSKRGAPADVVAASKDFVAQTEAWREKFFGLKSSGWMPSKSAAKSALTEGDEVAIVPEQREIYAYIPGLLEGTIKLFAGTILPGAKGKPTRVLVKSAEGQVYGFVPNTHLEICK